MSNRKKKLTVRQREVLSYMKRYAKKEGYPPSRREIADHFGFKSPNAVTDFMKALETKGHIKIEAETARGIKFLS